MKWIKIKNHKKEHIETNVTHAQMLDRIESSNMSREDKFILQSVVMRDSEQQ